MCDIIALRFIDWEKSNFHNLILIKVLVNLVYSKLNLVPKPSKSACTYLHKSLCSPSDEFAPIVLGLLPQDSDQVESATLGRQKEEDEQITHHPLMEYVLCCIVKDTQCVDPLACDAGIGTVGRTQRCSGISLRGGPPTCPDRVSPANHAPTMPAPTWTPAAPSPSTPH